MIKLDNRLEECAKKVKGNYICDIGTDHGYLPAYLIQSGKCEMAIASDIAEKPLEYARRTAEKYGVSEKTKLIISDGLNNIPETEPITDIVIAGMGGETIIKILENCPLGLRNRNFILQPMTKADLLRKNLYLLGFRLESETAVQEKDFIYTVMSVKYTGIRFEISEKSAETGKFDYTLESSLKYAEKRKKKYELILMSLKKSRNINTELARKAEDMKMTMENIKDYSETVGHAYDIIDKFAPFSYQEMWDISGLLVGDRYQKISKVLVSLDITNSVIEEAVKKNAQLIVSHHPVIFSPLKNIPTTSPVYSLIKNSVSAICVHTPLDITKGGMNDIIFGMLDKSLGLTENYETLEKTVSETIGFGRVCELKNETEDIKGLAETLKKTFGCKAVRYGNLKKPVKKIAYCSGSGGSLLELVKSTGADAYITGDVKHDVWLKAEELGIVLFDCGHYYTETLAMETLKELLQAELINTEVEIAENNRDCTDFV